MAFSFDWSIRVTDLVMGAAVLIGPMAAVGITLWAQTRLEKRAAKLNLFLTLMAERQGPISRDVTKALNTIDVVFSKCPPVLEVWHKYYALLAGQPSQERLHTWLELLTAMASELGYSIKQTDIDKFYHPQAHADDLEFQREVGKEWLRVLKNTNSLSVEQKK